MIVGIDLGTTNSSVGFMDGGFPILVGGAAGERLTPSAVWFPQDGRPVVGIAAMAQRESDPARVVTSVKRLMGQRAGDPLDPAPVYPVGGSPGAPIRIFPGGPDLLPEDVSALILKKLKSDAERALGRAITRAVITVPAYFNDGQRAATKRAGEMAGFVVERVVSEPTAAALACGLERLGEKCRVAVYDLGGGTFDISVLEFHAGVFEVLATSGDTRLGGDDLDAALSAGWGVSRAVAEKIKRELSLAEETTHDGGVFKREELERLCGPIVERTHRHCVRALADARVGTGDLGAVILVGGATRMPLVRKFVRKFFGREPDTSQNPDEAVALGATIQAGILDGSVRSMTLLDVTPLSLGLETFGGLMNVIIPRNTTIPCKAGEMFTNAATNQPSMRVTVLQGEREIARDNWKLGELDVAFRPAPKGLARVGIQFELDANGILHVLARDTATGLDTVAKITNAIEVSDEAVEKMLGDSLEHAFEDMDGRIFAEAVLKAEEMLPAVECALATLGEATPPEEKKSLVALMENVRAALRDKSTSRLKKTLAVLDDATQPLATRLMETALGTPVPEHSPLESDNNSPNREEKKVGG